MSKDAQAFLAEIHASVAKKAFGNNWDKNRIRTETRLSINEALNSDDAKSFSTKDIEAIKQSVWDIEILEKQEYPKIAIPKLNILNNVESKAPINETKNEPHYSLISELDENDGLTFKKVKEYITFSRLLRYTISISLAFIFLAKNYYVSLVYNSWSGTYSKYSWLTDDTFELYSLIIFISAIFCALNLYMFRKYPMERKNKIFLLNTIAWLIILSIIYNPLYSFIRGSHGTQLFFSLRINFSIVASLITLYTTFYISENNFPKE
jgi:hypothetical protein